MDTNKITPPPGFVLDEPQSTTPQPPPGFVLDQPGIEPLKTEKPDIFTIARMEAVERSAKPKWWDKYTALIDRTLGTFYGHAGEFMSALNKAASYISKKTGLEKSGIFNELAKEYHARHEYLRRKGMQGLPGEIAAGLGGAAFDIPTIMALGQWGLPIHGGLMGLAKGGVKGAAVGATTGALTHGALRGISELPTKAQLPTFFGFGAVTTPGGVEERVASGVTWAALGLMGRDKQVTVQEFLERYPRLDKLNEKVARVFIKKIMPEVTAEEIKQAGGAKKILTKIAEEAQKVGQITAEKLKRERPLDYIFFDIRLS